MFRVSSCHITNFVRLVRTCLGTVVVSGDVDDAGRPLDLLSDFLGLVRMPRLCMDLAGGEQIAPNAPRILKAFQIP